MLTQSVSNCINHPLGTILIHNVDSDINIIFATQKHLARGLVEIRERRYDVRQVYLHRFRTKCLRRSRISTFEYQCNR